MLKKLKSLEIVDHILPNVNKNGLKQYVSKNISQNRQNIYRKTHRTSQQSTQTRTFHQSDLQGEPQNQ